MTSRASLQAALADRLGSATEARWMVEEVLGPAASPRALGDAGTAATEVLDAMADRRLAGEPLQYVLGVWAFRALDLAVDTRALIPRPETEQVVEAVLDEARRLAAATPLVVVDLGTGSGAIALSLAVELRGAVRDGAVVDGAVRVVATDADAGALALAAENLARVAVRHPEVGTRVELRAGDWFDALAPELQGRVCLVVSNPPYVSRAEWASLDAEVRCEPYAALVAPDGSDGTPGFAAVEAVVRGAIDWLVPGGAVVVETAPAQTRTAAALAARRGYVEVRIVRDLAGRDRAVVARR